MKAQQKMLHRVFSLTIITCLALFGVANATDTSANVSSITDLTTTQQSALKTSLEAYKNLSTTDRATRGVTAGKAYLGNLITVRTRAVEKLEEIFSTGRCKGIDTTAKQAITTELTEIKASLTQEQTEVTAMTTTGNIRTMAQTIIEQNRVFVIAAPATYGACSAQNIIRVRTRTLDGLVIKLKNSGVTTTDIETYLSQASVEASSAYSYFLDALQTRSTTPTAKITSGKEALNRARNNLSLAQQEVQKVVAAPAVTQ